MEQSREQLMEKVVTLLQRTKEVALLKKSAVKDYDEQLGEIKKELDDVLRQLENTPAAVAPVSQK